MVRDIKDVSLEELEKVQRRFPVLETDSQMTIQLKHGYHHAVLTGTFDPDSEWGKAMWDHLCGVPGAAERAMIHNRDFYDKKGDDA